jgi:hypothetical protein
MTLKERILADLTAAMKARDALRLGVARMLKAKLQEAEVELRGTRGPAAALSEEETQAVIGAWAKQRRDAIEAFRRGGREDLATKEEAELAVAREYLPAALPEDELRRIIREAVAQSGASSPRDVGAVMKLVLPKVKGAADGRLVNQLVLEVLSGG